MTRLEGGPYKDAVRFSNGVEILLQRLDCGLTAVVVGSPELSAPAAADPVPEPVSETVEA